MTTGRGDSTRSGVARFGGDGYLGGLIGREGDNGPTGDMTMGDMGVKGGGADVINCVDVNNGVDRL